MKLATLCASLALVAWQPGAQLAPQLADDPAPLDAAVTRDGRVISVSIGAPRVLTFKAEHGAESQTLDVDLVLLPEDARVIAAQLGAFGDHGLAAALAIETGAGTEYRWLYTVGDPLRGRLHVPGPDAGPAPHAVDDWNLSAPLFSSTGAPYRLLDVHNPGGDSLELTFRRGALHDVRRPADGLTLDERVLHDVCPMGGRLSLPGSSVMVDVERVVAVK